MRLRRAGDVLMPNWAQYPIAFVVFCHGFIYVRIGAVLPGPITVWQGTSWLLGRRVTRRQVLALAIGLHVAAGLATLLASAAIVFPPLAPWWRPLLIGGSAVGIAAFAIFWDGQTRVFAEEGGIGVVVSAALLVWAVAFPAALG